MEEGTTELNTMSLKTLFVPKSTFGSGEKKDEKWKIILYFLSENEGDNAQWSSLVLERHFWILINPFKPEFDGLEISIGI